MKLLDQYEVASLFWSLRSSERGLKFPLAAILQAVMMSLRSSERGLKFEERSFDLGTLSRSVRRSVD